MTSTKVTNPLHIAVFASGNGTNAENIFRHFAEHPQITVSCLLCNKAGAGVLARADRHHIPSMVFDREAWRAPSGIINYLQTTQVDLIVLAGFLWLVPPALLEAFPERVINIHPALLPKYGGKGMYGMRVHEAVVAAQEHETGITIHYVNEQYDEGAVIMQQKVSLTPADSPELVAQKVHELEYAFFPQVIEETVLRKGKIG